MAVDLQNPVHLSMRKTLYLDFDGVLHPNMTTKSRRFIHLEALCCVLRNGPQVASGRDAVKLGSGLIEIVISSSWRFQFTLVELKAFFPMDLRQFVTGTTGPAFVGKHARWEEIRQHVRTHRVGDWRALDDSAFEFPRHCRELILCNGATGLMPEQLLALDEWLST